MRVGGVNYPIGGSLPRYMVSDCVRLFSYYEVACANRVAILSFSTLGGQTQKPDTATQYGSFCVAEEKQLVIFIRSKHRNQGRS
jgi:hypothetical protein